VFIYLAIYGFVDRAVPAALALRGVVAGTKNVQYSYVSGCVTTTCCFAERAGWDPDAVADLRELALDSPGRTFRPGPLALDGSMLKDPVDHLDRYPEGFPPAGQALQDIAMLAGLWVWGSTNPAWTRPRIAERIGVNMAWLHTLKRWEPWK
jgi:hypothetical protein